MCFVHTLCISCRCLLDSGIFLIVVNLFLYFKKEKRKHHTHYTFIYLYYFLSSRSALLCASCAVLCPNILLCIKLLFTRLYWLRISIFILTKIFYPILDALCPKKKNPKAKPKQCRCKCCGCASVSDSGKL